MNRDFGQTCRGGDGHGRQFRRSVRAVEKKLKRLTDAEFFNWDESVLACPLPGSFTEDREFVVLNAAMRSERRRRRDKHNGLFGWRRFLNPADRKIWLKYYEKAMEVDSRRPRKAGVNGGQVPEQAGH